MAEAQDEAYRKPAAEVVADLGSDATAGLSAAEASRRLAQHGRNELDAAPPVPAWRRLLHQFSDVLVVLLLVAVAISTVLWAVERDAPLPYEAIAIFAIVVLNALLGFIQEARAERSLAALKSLTAARASVVRDGVRQSVAATDLVPGDLILIEEGDAIPADARLIETISLQTAEAALTGRAFPSPRTSAPCRMPRASGTGATWSSAARSSPTGGDGRSSPRPG